MCADYSAERRRCQRPVSRPASMRRRRLWRVRDRGCWRTPTLTPVWLNCA